MIIVEKISTFLIIIDKFYLCYRYVYILILGTSGEFRKTELLLNSTSQVIG